VTALQLEEVHDEYLAAVCDLDAHTAAQLVLTQLDHGASPVRIIDEVIAPAQTRAGELWESGQWSYIDEHAVTAVTENVVSTLFRAVAPPRPRGPRILFACADGELHSLPARMAAVIAASGGARVTMLSSPLDVRQLGERLAARDVDLLALSCTMPLNLVGAARCIQAAHQVSVPVVVGGRAFGSDARRARAAGADGFATTSSALLCPRAAEPGPARAVAREATVLGGIDAATVDRAHARTMEDAPLIDGMDPAQTAMLREYLQWVARHAGAALAVGDPVVLDEFIAWWQRPAEHRMPSAVIALGARTVADVVEPQAPRGTLLLRAAAARANAPERGGPDVSRF
jgi:methanogenic corrinoid protein MtbC1